VEIRTFSTADEAANAVAQRVADAVRRHPDLVVGLPAGRTPIGAYTRLRQLHAAGEVDFARVTAFTVDEFAGIDRAHHGSFHRFIDEHLFSGVNLPANRIHSLNGMAPDLEAECARYEQEIRRAGGIGLQLLGIGSNGHIGFNEPADALIAVTHRVTLLDTTRRDNAALFGGNASDVPREALTMGVGTMLKAEAVILVATGASKAVSVERMVRGPMTTRLPASLLQAHRHVEIYLDRGAASRL
jgi:glucosamine-6-phosphate deaminase